MISPSTQHTIYLSSSNQNNNPQYAYNNQPISNQRKISPSPPVNRISNQGLTSIAVGQSPSNANGQLPNTNYANLSGTNMDNNVLNDNLINPANRSHSSSATRQGPSQGYNNNTAPYYKSGSYERN